MFTDSDTTDSSPEEGENKPVVEVFDLQESSPEDISPDMESQALFVKLKEVRNPIVLNQLLTSRWSKMYFIFFIKHQELQEPVLV